MRLAPASQERLAPASQERLAPASQETAVLRLAVALTPDRAAGLADEVMDRVGAAGPPVGTVVLALDGGGDIDGLCWQALHALQDSLRVAGVRLLLVVATRQARQQLRDAGKDQPAGSLAVHPSLRSAVLAAYAALPGPGLVTAQVRAVLDLPAEQLTSRVPSLIRRG